MLFLRNVLILSYPSLLSLFASLSFIKMVLMLGAMSIMTRLYAAKATDRVPFPHCQLRHAVEVDGRRRTCVATHYGSEPRHGRADAA